MLLSVLDLEISYAKSKVPTVQGVNFKLNDGEILTIVGESGSGKVTKGAMIFDYKNLRDIY